MTTVYISGPMTGFPDYNYPAFDAAEQVLRELGFEVINPAAISRQLEDKSWSNCMRKDIAALMECDIVVTLPGWLMSRGANIEVRTANSLDIQVYDFQPFIRSNRMGGRLINGRVKS